MDKKSRILIIGSGGFVGSNLYKDLQKNNYENISTISLRNEPKKHNLSAALFDNKIEYVFNCAAQVGGIGANIKDPYGFLYNNVEIQNIVIDTCLKSPFLKRCLFLGSSCIYPTNCPQPMKEEYLLTGVPEPTNEGYALAKIIGLKMCEYANKQYKRIFLCVQPPNLYGPGDHYELENSHVLSALVKKISDAKRKNQMRVEIWGGGIARREFMYIEDLIDCMKWLFINNIDSDKFLNVGTGEDISIAELAFKIKKISGYVGSFNFDYTKPEGMKKKLVDNSKISNLGWKSKTTLNEGLKKTIDWYVNNATD